MLNVERVQRLSTANTRSPSSTGRPIQTLLQKSGNQVGINSSPTHCIREKKSSPRRRLASCLSEAACLTLPLKKAKDVALSARPLYVSDDGAVWVIEEFDADLGHVTGVAGAAEHLGYLRALHRDIL